MITKFFLKLNRNFLRNKLVLPHHVYQKREYLSNDYPEFLSNTYFRTPNFINHTLLIKT